VAGKMPSVMEELRTQTQYQPANDPLGLSKAATQEIVNRLLDELLIRP